MQILRGRVKAVHAGPAARELARLAARPLLKDDIRGVPRRILVVSNLKDPAFRGVAEQTPDVVHEPLLLGDWS